MNLLSEEIQSVSVSSGRPGESGFVLRQRIYSKRKSACRVRDVVIMSEHKPGDPTKWNRVSLALI